jgi:exopolysaccharide production protein ExoZ
MFSNIQALRAIAAAMVFFFHAADHYRALGGQSDIFLAFAAFGFSGVDIFFVISGFVVAHTTLGKTRTLSSAISFSKRRLMRIYLGYWPFYALTLVTAYIYEPAVQADQQFLLSFLLGTIDAKGMVLFVSWSLSFEAIFYALVTATFGIAVEPFKRLVQASGVLIFIILVWTYTKPHSSYLMFASCLFEFIAGMTIYIHKDYLTRRWLIAPIAAVVVIAFLVGIRLQATNGSVRIFTFGTGAVALVMLSVVLDQSKTAIATGIAVALGNASYTLYLAHPVLLGIFYFWGIRDLLALQSPLIREAGFFLYLGLCIGISQILYALIERPLYRWAIDRKTLRN